MSILSSQTIVSSVSLHCITHAIQIMQPNGFHSGCAPTCDQSVGCSTNVGACDCMYLISHNYKYFPFIRNFFNWKFLNSL